MRQILFYTLTLLLCSSCLVAQEKSPSSIPDPADLNTSWWNYLKDEKTFEENSDKLIDRLTQLQKEIDKKRSLVLFNEIELVILSLKDLKDYRNEKIDYKPIPPLYLDTYFLSDWLTISQNIRELNQKMERLRSINLRIQANRDLLRQNLDLYQIHYALLTDSPVMKIHLGLEIMRVRIDLEGATIRINRNNKRLSLMEKDLQKLKKEKIYAQDHFSFENLTVKGQLEKADQAKKIFEEAQENLIKVEKEDKASGPNRGLRNMKIEFATIQAETAYAKVIFQRIILDLVRQVKKNENAINNIAKWEGYIDIISNKIKSWQNLIDATKVADSPVASEMIKVKNQTEATLSDLQGVVADANLLIDEFREIEEEKSPLHTKIFLKTWNTIINVSAITSGLFSYTLFRINDYPVTIWIIIRAFLIVFISIVGGKMVTGYIRSRQVMKRKVGKSNLYTISKIAYYLLVLVGILAAFFSIGFDMTNFVIIGGALGVGIGLGLQSIANNFFAGIVLLFEKRLRVGDIIEIDAQDRGTVQSINIQNTTIRTFDGREVVVPNSDFLTKQMINWTMNDDYIRLQVPFGVAYGSDVEKVKKAVIDAAKECPLTVLNEKICPAPIVWMVEFADSSINFELVVWVDLSKELSKSGLYSHYLYLIEKTLRKNSITIPFPQRDLWVKQLPEN